MEAISLYAYVCFPELIQVVFSRANVRNKQNKFVAILKEVARLETSCRVQTSEKTDTDLKHFLLDITRLGC